MYRKRMRHIRMILTVLINKNVQKENATHQNVSFTDAITAKWCAIQLVQAQKWREERERRDKFMTVKELNNKSFEEVMEQLNEEWDDVHTYESMADFVGDLILNQNDIYLAIHMLEAMRDNPAEWYLYDFTMGTMETPRAITCREDLEEVIEERIQGNEKVEDDNKIKDVFHKEIEKC